MGKYRVLGFDGWTMGSHHYSRLLSAFSECGIDFVLVHLGSWGDEIGRPKEEIIDGMLVRDIAYYGQCSFDHILETERPDVVLFLSTETFLHQAFQRYCFAKSIPTLHLFHGLLGVVPHVVGVTVYKISPLRQLMYVLERVGKFVRRTVWVYSRSLIKTRGTFADWCKFAQDVTNRIKGVSVVIPARDSRATRCCVYTKADYVTTEVKWKYESGEVVAVGNPDLGRFGLDEKLLGSAIRSSAVPDRRIVYIDSGISSHGTNFSSDREYVSYLQNCARSLRERNYNLCVKLKPHPSSRFEFLRDQLMRDGITVLENDEYVPALVSSSGCIAEPSTASLIPCLLGLPVFLARVGKLNTLLYGDVFDKYPRAMYLGSWEDIPDHILPIPEAVTARATDAWIADNAGPMPAADMPKRVARVVLELATSR